MIELDETTVEAVSASGVTACITRHPTGYVTAVFGIPDGDADTEDKARAQMVCALETLAQHLRNRNLRQLVTPARLREVAGL